MSVTNRYQPLQVTHGNAPLPPLPTVTPLKGGGNVGNAKRNGKGAIRLSNAGGEHTAIGGWLAYGVALNEGRSLFPSDEQFGEWLVSSNLRLSENDKMERSAAMWAAANQDDFAAASAAGNARTVRGIYAKWQEMDADRRAAEERETHPPLSKAHSPQTGNRAWFSLLLNRNISRF